MDIQPKLEGVVKTHFNLGYKIDIFRDILLKFSHIIQCKPTNDIMMK